jgi:hypothetical protein
VDPHAPAWHACASYISRFKVKSVPGYVDMQQFSVSLTGVEPLRVPLSKLLFRLSSLECCIVLAEPQVPFLPEGFITFNYSCVFRSCSW